MAVGSGSFVRLQSSRLLSCCLTFSHILARLREGGGEIDPLSVVGCAILMTTGVTDGSRACHQVPLKYQAQKRVQFQGDTYQIGPSFIRTQETPKSRALPPTTIQPNITDPAAITGTEISKHPSEKHIKTSTMSFLFGQRPQPSSAEKIAAAEAEIEMVSNMFNQ